MTISKPTILLRLLTLLAGVALTPPPARAVTAPPGFVVENAFPNQPFVLPVQVVFMPDGRRLVVEKEGRVWTINSSGVKLAAPFIDLTAKVLSNDDRGLLGVALDPDFATNRWVYMLYTVDPDSNGTDDNIPAFGRLERYQASISNPNVADLTTRQILIGTGFPDGVPEPARNRHHMVGTLRFAADKTLLIGSGDGANADVADAGGTDPSFGAGLIANSQDIGSFRSQTLNSMDGKIMRVDKETGLGLPSNPFWNGSGAASRSRAWLYGLRNPFRFSVRPGTGSTNPSLGQPGVLYIGDVGWNTTEEFDIARTGGINFGWPCFEGGYATPQYPAISSTYFPNPNVICGAPLSAENPIAKTLPVYWWNHTTGSQSNPSGWVGNCAIGGVFATGLTWPAAYQNLYFLGDYGQGWIRSLRMDANDNVVSASDFISGGGGVVDIETDPATGDLYYIDVYSNTIFHVRYSTGEPPPVVNASISPSSGFSPLTVSAVASGSTDSDGDALSYTWTFGDGGTSHHADTTYTYTTTGSYMATVVVDDGHGGIAAKSIPVVVGQVAPPGKIVQPVTGTTFYQNQLVSLQASPVDTSVTPATFRWDIDLGHNEHFHPSVSVYFGRTATFDAAVTPNDGGHYHFRIRLTVTQGALSTSDTVRIYPRVNLAASALNFTPPYPGRNSTFQVSAKVRSTGEMGAPPVTFQVFDNNTVLATDAVPAILQGDSLVVSATVGPLSFGDHALRLQVDPDAALVETDEGDNITYGTVTVAGLIAAYGLNEGSGGQIGDASGNNITGTIAGATWVNPGEYGRGLSFNGTNNYVDLGNPPIMATPGSMTWSAWVRPQTTPGDDGMILGRSDDNGGWQLKTTPDTGPRTFGIAVTGGSGVRTQRYSTTQPQLNTWYNVAAVYDATALTLDLYVNGSLDDGVLSGVVPPTMFDPQLAATIGKRVGGFYFGGLIDEVRIYNRALSQAEIQSDMTTPLSSGAVGLPGGGGGPVAYSLALRGANPFHTLAAINWSQPRAGKVRLQVFDVAGKLVETLEDGMRTAGVHTSTFEPRRLSSGLYLCRFEAGTFVATRKLLLVR